MAMKANELMTKNPSCVTPQTTAQEAASLMEREDVGSLPVVESRESMRLVGIVTDRDLALRVLARGESGSTPVSNAMSSGNLASIRPEDDLDKVERLMSEHQVRRIPVVDDSKRVVGMIAQADLAREQKAVGRKDFGKVLEEISEPGRGLTR
ncbi:MAG TPA: CBS domain-containing protein [Thermoanaerobaculia bacterium]|nr:CBS domain-containing protein [Thermoanaerobaculia bacterium]